MSQIYEQSMLIFPDSQASSLDHNGWNASQVSGPVQSETGSYIPVQKRRRSIIAMQTLAGTKKERHIPRPPNCFMLFRTDFVAKRSPNQIIPGDETLSKLAGKAWRALSTTERKYWAKKALEASEEHARKYPTWKYNPRRKGGGRKRKLSIGQQRLEQSMFTFHSKPDVSPSLPSTAVPSHLIHRKQSLRLSNWDDSVLAPNPNAASSWYGNKEIPEVLRRRSSSVPLPESPNQNPNTSMHSYEDPSQANLPPLHQHRLSFSGIRPGFVPMNITPLGSLHEPQPQQAVDASLLSLPEDEADAMKIFGDYKITYTSNNDHSRPGHPVTSTSRQFKALEEYNPVEHSSPSSQTNPYYTMYHSPASWNHELGYQSAASTTTVSPTTGPNSNDSFQVSLPLPVTDAQFGEMSFTDFLNDGTEPEHLVERMRSIDFGSSHGPAAIPAYNPSTNLAGLKPLPQSDVDFSPNNNSALPLSPFFPQYTQYRGSLQLTGLNDIFEAAIVDPQPQRSYFGRDGSLAYRHAPYENESRLNSETFGYSPNASTSTS